MGRNGNKELPLFLIGSANIHASVEHACNAAKLSKMINPIYSLLCMRCNNLTQSSLK